MSNSTMETKAAGQIELVRRADIPAKALSPDGLTEDRPFAAHPILSKSLFSSENIEFAWCRVLPSQTPPQVASHSSRVLLLVLSGSAEMVGSKSGPVKEGDAIAIPANSPYGFTAVAEPGLQLLRLGFHTKSNGATREITSLEALLARNEERTAQFLKNPFFDLLRDDTLTDPAKLAVFRPTVRVFSDWFQTLLFTREATCFDDTFRSTFADHFREEVGHNELLGERKRDTPVRDSVLNALLSWFSYQMIVLDNVEKAVLVHLVLETAGHHFESLGSANASLRKDTSAKYFEAHAADDQHKDMVSGLITGCHPRTYQRLGVLLDEGWDTLGEITNRMAFLIRNNAGQASKC
jgi:mannose-6-phosphate isomerase-like protein (cupin superfamily)